MGVYGADVAQLRDLAKQFDQAASRLENVRHGVDGRAQLRAWTGPVAARFRTSWSAQYAPSIERAAGSIRQASLELRRNADEQERASAGGSDYGSAAWVGVAFGATKWGVKLVSGVVKYFKYGVLSRFTPRWPNGQFRSLGGMSFFEKFKAGLEKKSWVAKPGQVKSLGTWSKISSKLGVVGAVVGGASTAWDQWQKDSTNPSMSTTAKTSRAVYTGAVNAAVGFAAAGAGAKVGIALGAAVGGPVGAAVGGIVGGLVGGAIGSGLASVAVDATKDLVGKAADTVKDATTQAAKKVGSWLSSLNPFK